MHYGSPSFHKNIHRERACLASNSNIFICREDTDPDAHTAYSAAPDSLAHIR